MNLPKRKATAMETLLEETSHSFLAQVESGQSLVSKANFEKASTVIKSTPLPTRRVEAWKYTRVNALKKRSFTIGNTSISETAIEYIHNDALNIIMINGCYSKELSNIENVEGVTITPLQHDNYSELTAVPLEGELFNSINAVYTTSGLKITINKNAQLSKTIQLIHVVTGNEVMANVRVQIEAEAFSKAEIIHSFQSVDATDCFVNSVMEVSVAKNAYLTIQKLQNECENNIHLNSEYIQQADDSNFTINTITLNGTLVRNNLNINVEGQNCETHLNGAYLLKENQHVDNHTTVDHLKPNCESHELYKGIINDQATAVFNGKVFVRKDAQKINAFQSNANVLLSDNATVNSKPELEIYADDVKCSHGSTTGQLDDEAIFYLRARGLSETSAKQLMVSAFIGDVLEKIESQEVLDYIYKNLNNRFGWIY